MTGWGGFEFNGSYTGTPVTEINGVALPDGYLRFMAEHNGGEGDIGETVVCLSQQKPDDHIEIEIDLDEIDATSAETKAAYKEIQDWVQEKYGFHVTNLNIAQVKQEHGIIERENYNKPKSENSKQPGCPEEKIKAIEDAMRHFQMI